MVLTTEKKDSCLIDIASEIGNLFRDERYFFLHMLDLFQTFFNF